MKLIVLSTCTPPVELGNISPELRDHLQEMAKRNARLTELLHQCQQALAASRGQLARIERLLDMVQDVIQDELLKD